MNGALSAFLQILNTKCYYKTINVNFFCIFLAYYLVLSVKMLTFAGVIIGIIGTRLKL